MKLMTIFLAIFLCHMAAGRPYLEDFFLDDFFVDVKDCHGIRCPEGTAVCIQNVTTSNDLKITRTHLLCEDAQGRELLSEVKQEANRYEGTSVESYSFRGSYSRSGSGNTDVNVRVNTGNGDKHEYDTVETFD